MISDDGEKCFHSRWVRASYGVASAYVLADTADKGQKMNKVRRPEPGPVLSLSCDVNISVQMPDSDSGKVALAAFDTLVWQAFASVIVPGSLANLMTVL